MQADAIAKVPMKVKGRKCTSKHVYDFRFYQRSWVIASCAMPTRALVQAFVVHDKLLNLRLQPPALDLLLTFSNA